jgi:DnaJ domain
LPDIVLALLLLLLIGGGWMFLAPNSQAAARAIRYAAVGALVLLGLFLAISGRAFLDVPVGALIILLGRGWFARGSPGLNRFKAWLDGMPYEAGKSTIETPWLRMTLDQETGALGGVVLAGRFQGLHLDQLSFEQLRALLDELGTVDTQSARLLEAFMDRAHDGWRTSAGSQRQESANERADPTVMTEQEAWQVLGLEPGACQDAIREAHHKLMMKLHPDHGGSTYLARQINAARDVLLGN